MDQASIVYVKKVQVLCVMMKLESVIHIFAKMLLYRQSWNIKSQKNFNDSYLR